jgi:hypothetical protein
MSTICWRSSSGSPPRQRTVRHLRRPLPSSRSPRLSSGSPICSSTSPRVVLHGPPGTGKSYWAEQAARELAARDWFGRRFGALTEPERQSLTNPGGAIEMCTFHPGYGYEDFVEGLRPTVVQGQLAFELRDGLFKQLCRRAIQRPDRRFFLVIDEINRGDLPRIFGELLTLLEADKRGWSVTLALSQERFVVPPNVAILATMNTADRSIALLDAALRRRFAFHELMPDPAALGDSVVLGLPLGPLLGWINESLVRALGAGMRHLQIGHAYLMHNRQPIADPTRLAEALRNDIVPLLEEYCHDQRQHLRSIVGAGLFRGNSLEVDASPYSTPPTASVWRRPCASTSPSACEPRRSSISSRAPRGPRTNLDRDRAQRVAACAAATVQLRASRARGARTATRPRVSPAKSATDNSNSTPAPTWAASKSAA